MKKILLITTGGTIASSPLKNGLTPTFNAEQILSYLPEIKDLCQVSGISLMSIDSTNMNPERIQIIGKTIFENYNDYDGFIISHGTDTMAYTAAALTYMLPNIKKPVVILGSQRSIDEKYTDAKQNIIDAFHFSIEGIQGIFVAFDGKIMLGSRVMKLKTKSIDAFSSINFPIIATVKFGKVTYNRYLHFSEQGKLLFSETNESFQFMPNMCKDVLLIKMFPGIKPDLFDYLKNHYKGVIIESFGIGGIPNEDPNILDKIDELTQAGVAVVITTQCLEEGIDLNVYEVGKDLAKLPVIYAGDMNTEAIVMKLMWALGNLKGYHNIKQFIETSIFGDMTV